MGFFPNLGVEPLPKYATNPVLEHGSFSTLWYKFLNSLPAAIAGIIAALTRYFAVGPVITDTHAGRVNYDASVYQRFPLFEVDRRALYTSRQPTGIVDTSAGVAVSLDSGDQFDAAWIGKTITINGNLKRTIVAVPSNISITIDSTVGALTAVSFTVDIFEWFFAAGTMHCVLLADLPGDLGLADDGFLADEAEYEHCYKWNGLGWRFAKQDDHQAGQISASAEGGAPLGGVWQICDGSTVTVSAGDGTTVNRTAPALQGDTWIVGTAVDTPTRAAARAKWEAGAVTDDESTHTHPIGNIPELVPAVGATVNLDTAPNTGPGTAHHHALTDANAQLKVPSIANGGVPLNYGLVFYMRR